MKGGRTSDDVQAKIDVAASIRVPKGKRGSAKGAPKLTADQVWTDDRAPRRLPPPAAASVTISGPRTDLA